MTGGSDAKNYGSAQASEGHPASTGADLFNSALARIRAELRRQDDTRNRPQTPFSAAYTAMRAQLDSTNNGGAL